MSPDLTRMVTLVEDPNTPREGRRDCALGELSRDSDYIGVAESQDSRLRFCGRPQSIASALKVLKVDAGAKITLTAYRGGEYGA